MEVLPEPIKNKPTQQKLYAIFSKVSGEICENSVLMF